MGLVFAESQCDQRPSDGECKGTSSYKLFCNSHIEKGRRPYVSQSNVLCSSHRGQYKSCSYGGAKIQTNLISEGSLNDCPQAEPPSSNLQINPPSGPAADGVTVCWFPAFDFLLKGRGRWEIELP